MASKEVKSSKASASQPLRRWEEENDEDFCNPDQLLACPYDPNHKIRACRFPYHLIKCRRNHPEEAKLLWTCPFNARHLMSRHELSDHILNCVNKCSINTGYVESVETKRKFHIPVNNWTLPACDEDWDKEEEESAEPAAPFVWGLPISKIVQERTEQSLRAPRILPWEQDK